jgi:O-antigen/teichoic acid export membrane protein
VGVIAKQSSYAAIALGVGLVLGAANNMAVLPRAFEGKEEIWGLVRIMTSWGVICAALATLGAPGAIVRFLNRYSDKERDKALNSILAIALAGLTLTLGTILTFGEYWVTKLDPTNADLLTAHAPWFLAIMAIMSLLHIFRSLLTLALRTGYVSWIDEVWQKLSYVSLAVLLFFDAIPLHAFVPMYVATYGVSLVLLGIPNVRLFQRVSAGWNRQDMPQFLEYSGFSLFAGSTIIIAMQLDSIMIAKYLGLEEVPMYTIGFFIGSVVGMPGRATVNIVKGVLADKVHAADDGSIDRLNKRTARINVLLMTSLMAGIWAAFDPFQQLLPENYRGLEWVFVCIGLSRIIAGLNNSNNQHLALSEHYRLVLPVNIALVAVTIAMNYLFLVIFEWGLSGAALATLGTFVWNNAWRLWLVNRKLGVHPFTWSLPVIGAIGLVFATLFHWEAGQLGLHPLVEASIQGTLASGGCFVVCYGLGFFPELRAGIKHRLPWWP